MIKWISIPKDESFIFRVGRERGLNIIREKDACVGQLFKRWFFLREGDTSIARFREWVWLREDKHWIFRLFGHGLCGDGENVRVF